MKKLEKLKGKKPTVYKINLENAVNNNCVTVYKTLTKWNFYNTFFLFKKYSNFCRIYGKIVRWKEEYYGIYKDKRC